MAIFADVPYCIYADKVGGLAGSKKGQKYADVIYGMVPYQTPFLHFL